MDKHEKSSINFLFNQANTKDLNHLDEWLKDPMNSKFFESYVKTNYIIDVSINSFNLEKAKQIYLNQIKKDKVRYKWKKTFKKPKYIAAAMLIGILICGYIFRQDIFYRPKETTKPIIVNNNIKPGTSKAVLTLDNGEEITFAKGVSIQTQNAKSNGEEIIYNKNKTNDKPVYNTLTIPRGGQFFLKLSDGTQIWLNSATKIKYPVSFIEGQAREVELIYGEAYFEVTASTKNKGSHFKVLGNNQSIEVLGTEFNVRAYADEPEVFTTLAKGKLQVLAGTKQQVLMPREQLQYNYQMDMLLVKKDVDIYRQISWKEGIFSFKQMSLENIMKTLSRWYDIDVVFEDRSLLSKGFNGSLGKKQSIEEILESIKNFGVIKNYEIRNKTVILK